MSRLHPWGLVVAAVFFTLRLTPSLLVRDWFYQGLVSGWLINGHNYGDAMVPGFAAIAADSKFSRDDIERVQSQMDQVRELGG
ncbi:hypothetical protein [Corynebacterium cystitidis]|uniref:hypothetical protein n=1 Tax=Corynebacterium cystitidis TaxID=35757 RepID=UPI00211F121A|nr:hypothetical protein [Corynebacterium cystitidis]